MPWIYYRCDTCYRKTCGWDDEVRNTHCGEDGDCQGTLIWKRAVYGVPPSGRNAQGFTPCVLFRDLSKPEGEYRVPGWSDEPTPAGHEKVEIKTLDQWRRITKEMSAHGRRQAEAAHYERQQAIDKVRAEQRAELRDQMRHWDGPAREFAAHALARSESRKRREAPTGEVIAHALEFDASNREAWRDKRTGWRGRRS